MVKTLLAVMLIAASVSASAQTINSCNSVIWDYSADRLSSIDGFYVYVNGTQAGSVPSSQQTIPCLDIGLNQPGIFSIEVTAYNAVGESAKSVPLSVSVVTTVPTAPSGLTVN